MRRFATLIAALAVSALGFASAANAAATVCYDVNVNVQGNGTSQADCINV